MFGVPGQLGLRTIGTSAKMTIGVSSSLLYLIQALNLIEQYGSAAQ